MDLMMRLSLRFLLLVYNISNKYRELVKVMSTKAIFNAERFYICKTYHSNEPECQLHGSSSGVVSLRSYKASISAYKLTLNQFYIWPASCAMQIDR